MTKNDYRKWRSLIENGSHYTTDTYRKFKKWYTKLYHNKPWYKKALASFTTFIVVFLLYLIMVDINFLWLFGKSPTLSSIHNPEQPIASEIYSADGKLIGKYFRENRSPVSYEEISPLLIKTLISTEDERFYQHFGIDFQGVFAAIKDMAKGDARGASTLTQQLVKNMFKVRSQYSTGIIGKIPGLKLLIMKSKEWITAVKIEMFYSKQEILTMYLNTVDFGSNAYGIKTACKTYFHTTPMEITCEQGATLVGLLKATTTYNPRLHPENSMKRRNVVLENLWKHHGITRAEYDSIKQIPINLNYNVETNYDGKALYFREAVADYLAPWCKENGIDLYADGLKIYTTLDSRMQQYAEAAANRQMRIVQRNFNNHWGNQAPWRDRNHREIPHFIEDLAKRTASYKILAAKYPAQPDSINYYLNLPHRLKVFDYDSGTRDTTISTIDSIRYMEHFMHCSFVAMEPQTGHVKAWVGDINFGSWKYDKVLSKRQPGSTFKLFVYTAGFNAGMSPCDYRIDQQDVYNVIEDNKPAKWIPRNANGEYTGDTLSLKAAFARSVNTIAVQVGQEVGIHKVAETAHVMGIKTPLEETPALSLGASDVSLLELVNAYSTVINEGKTHDPILIMRIEDANGKIIYEDKTEQRQVLPYETAFLMTEMLKAGLTEPLGTSQALWGYDLHRYNTEFGGKTGTSSNHSDAWFVGVTPKLIGGSWVGGEHRSIHFRTGELGQGSRTALPIFAYFMEQVLKDNSLKQYQARFPQAKEKISKEYGCRTIYHPHDTDSIAIDSIALKEIIEE
ncbi:transglycosylase domain-containing protein [Bacteroides helcogenes]|nr:transglycosylase domain-containing protein [Bacteroides helcogenes]MDY5239398.1 transglycosylase domain-containing protein [Bacteroides helcogenes]